MHQSLKVSAKVQQAVKKANGMLAFIVRGFEYSVVAVNSQILSTNLLTLRFYLGALICKMDKHK